jgi:signal transduction histidine kinase
VRQGCQRMAQLIDDLLNLSRVSRQEIRTDLVDLVGLAQSVFEQIQSSEPKRRVEFIVPKSLVALGDPGLLRALFENLLGNAWKFTAKTEDARIEVGVMPDREETMFTTFFVRDNGAGFDMAAAERLFGAFQRLHSQQEFPGTGIGLATVQRIVRRHGGQIWAEAAIGQGASFFFTLGIQGTSGG